MKREMTFKIEIILLEMVIGAYIDNLKVGRKRICAPMNVPQGVMHLVRVTSDTVVW